MVAKVLRTMSIVVVLFAMLSMAHSAAALTSTDAGSIQHVSMDCGGGADTHNGSGARQCMIACLATLPKAPHVRQPILSSRSTTEPIKATSSAGRDIGPEPPPPRTS